MFVGFGDVLSICWAFLHQSATEVFPRGRWSWMASHLSCKHEGCWRGSGVGMRGSKNGWTNHLIIFGCITCGDDSNFSSLKSCWWTYPGALVKNSAVHRKPWTPAHGRLWGFHKNMKWWWKCSSHFLKNCSWKKLLCFHPRPSNLIQPKIYFCESSPAEVGAIECLNEEVHLDLEIFRLGCMMLNDIGWVPEFVDSLHWWEWPIGAETSWSLELFPLDLAVWEEAFSQWRLGGQWGGDGEVSAFLRTLVVAACTCSFVPSGYCFHPT